MLHRRAFAVGSALLTCWGGSTAARAASGELQLICPYAAGGGSDTRARQLAKFLADQLHSPVNVSNLPGAGGSLGTEKIAHAKPDGLTLGMGNFAPLAVNRHLAKNPSFDPVRELTPICLLERGPLVLTVPLQSELRSVADLIAAAQRQAQRGQPLRLATGGLGGTHHLSTELLAQTLGVRLQAVHHDGGAPAAQALVAQQVDAMFQQLSTAAPAILEGKVRALAVTSRKRTPLLAQLPTLQEAGLRNFEVLNWQGLVGPAGLPREHVQKFNALCNQALSNPTFRHSLLADGAELGGGSPEWFAAWIAAESQRWGKVIREAGIAPS